MINHNLPIKHVSVTPRQFSDLQALCGLQAGYPLGLSEDQIEKLRAICPELERYRHNQLHVKWESR